MKDDSWSCSSCANWGSELDFGLSQRECMVTHCMLVGDHIPCTCFKKALRAMTIAEAIESKAIPKPISMNEL
mgnify:CR=1 FL=1